MGCYWGNILKERILFLISLKTGLTNNDIKIIHIDLINQDKLHCIIEFKLTKTIYKYEFVGKDYKILWTQNSMFE